MNTWRTLKGNSTMLHLIAREHTNRYLGVLYETRCGLSHRQAGSPSSGPTCKRCALYAKAHNIPLPELPLWSPHAQAD